MKRKIIGVVLGLSALLAFLVFRLCSNLDSVPSSCVPEVVQAEQSSDKTNVVANPDNIGGGSGRLSLVAATNAENDPDRQSEILERAAQTVPWNDIPSKLEAVIGKDLVEGAPLQQLLVRRWAEQDPRAAAAWVMEYLDNKEAVVQVAIAWAGIDPQAAATWAISLPQNPAKEQALLDIAYEIAGTQPTVAVGMVSSLAAGPDRDNLLIHAVSQWASKDSQAASIWVQQIGDDALRQRLQGALAVSLADVNQADAAVLAANLAPGAEQDRAVIGIVQRWAQSAPTSAGAWICAFPDTPLRRTALETLVGVWSVQDVAGAASWVRGLAPGPLREGGLGALAAANLALPR